jgi:hypothetical protein
MRPPARYASLKTGMRTGFLTIAVLIGALSVRAQGQDVQSQGASRKDAPTNESRGMPPRAAPAEYQAQTQAGMVTVAAEFMGHAVPTPDGTYSTEDFVVVEVGLFGSPEARTRLSMGDFSLRINGKKIASPSQPYELAFKSLKDPEWEPPSKAQSKSKTSLGGGGGGDSDPAPAPVHMPLDLRRAMEQRVQRASMLEGDRALPQAGLLFFEYRGKTQGIRSLELIYSGSAGNAVLALQP